MSSAKHDYEKLGAFYLGRTVPDEGEPPAPLLYDSADLTTHAVIIGMTGSGKTGLGIGLIEEAALDHIPVIAVDPKGDLGNLLLTFPALEPGDFLPWVDAREAALAGKTPEVHAAEEAERWRRGLADWNQDPDRIARLRESAGFRIYTPGSSAGDGLSMLASLAPPGEGVREDPELYRQHVQAVASGLLLLAGIDSDPLSGREHILLATVLDQAWQRGRGLDLAALVAAIQAPGVERIGVLDTDTFFPPKERFALAMRFNGLLASPGFTAWTAGEALDVGRLLHTTDGRPRVSVISIAHLGEQERLFVLTLLLNAIIGWMRSQPGTPSLRAILYMDELAGYLPPVANPPTKNLLLTLFRQARAYGLGVVVASQNPVDLDYRALANAGTWFLGRLQTAQDRRRVRDGLLAATAGAGLDAETLDERLGSLGKRQFLLHNVHESEPVVFETRWVLSYLRGPLTREDLRRLRGPDATAVTVPVHETPTVPVAGRRELLDHRPVMPPGIPVAFVEPERLPGTGERLVYEPFILGLARLAHVHARHGIDQADEVALALPLAGKLPPHLDWEAATEFRLPPQALANDPEPDAFFAPWPGGAQALRPSAWERQFRDHLRTTRALVLWRSRALDTTSMAGETQGAFRARLQQLARETRDREEAAVRRRYEPRFRSLEEQLRKARQALGRENEQARAASTSTAVQIGVAVLGALLGGRRGSSASRAATAVRQASRASQQRGDVARAEANVEALERRLEDLRAEVDAALAAIGSYDALAEELEEIRLTPKAADVTLRFLGIAWLPYIQDGTGQLGPAHAGLSVRK